MAVKKSKKLPATANPYGQIGSHNTAVQEVILSVDKVAYEMECKWGAGVLPKLVDQAMHDKFLRVVDKLNDAIESNDYDTVKINADNLIRGWRKLDELATAAGHDKEPDFYTVTDGQGVDYWIVRDSLAASRLMAKHPNRASSIVLASSVAELLTSRLSVTRNGYSEKADILKPSVKSLDELLGDTIPF